METKSPPASPAVTTETRNAKWMTSGRAEQNIEASSDNARIVDQVDSNIGEDKIITGLSVA